jgi:2-polyprenyl-3-methyl-5-hydroxy-6-metoxy-1,4-benzoquinol methylase
MANDRLNIIAVEVTTKSSPSKKITRREDAIEKIEELWTNDPEQFNSNRNAMERERIERTFQMISNNVTLENKKAADLGCGIGLITQKLSINGANVLALDLAKQALKAVEDLKLNNIKITQDYLPNTMLKDNAYDLVVSTDVIAFLNQDQYRLYFSELCRLINPEGYVVCSSPIDINSEDAIQRFASLAETEFEIKNWILSYHAYHIRLLNLLSAPVKFAKAWKNKDYRQKEIDQRNSLSKKWFRLNSTPILGAFWSIGQYIFKPFVHLFRQNRTILLGMESLCRFLCTDSGISHAIFIGKRRPITEHLVEEEIPQERKHKKEVWE